VQGQTQEAEVTTNQRVTVNIVSRAKDTLQYTITLDSVKVITTAPIPTGDQTKLMGLKFTGAMSPHGKFFSSTPSDTSAEVASAIDGMQRFLIPFSGSPKVGSSWVDTVSSKVTRQGVDVSTQAISTYKLTGDTTVAGQKAWRVQRNTAIALSGSGSSQGQPITLEGTGTSTGAFFVSDKGQYLASNNEQNVDLKIGVPAAGMEIPQTVRTTTKVEILK